jgi:lipid-A-disaccharide synthase
MKYYIIAGEASGDLHGANLMAAIKKLDSKAEFRFWGGDKMQAEGGVLVKHYKDLAFMGFLEVIQNLRTILGNLSFCKKDLLAYNPDAVIFVDYPGFNMRIARFAKANNIPTHYYISPTVWAWKEGRVKQIKRDVDHLYSILPFEEKFYADRHDYQVHYVGNPLLDALNQIPKVDEVAFRKEYNLSADKPIIALLPGSRKQEISKILGVMLEVIKDFPSYEFIIAGAPSLEESFYRQFLDLDQVHFISNKTYEILSCSYAALVTSGTATLETALFKVPQVVCYKANEVSYRIAKALVNLKYISLVNLIMDRLVVEELIQDDLNPKRLKLELEKILDPTYREEMFSSYHELEEILGSGGASDLVASKIVDTLPT